jgi:hypothetical protein
MLLSVVVLLALAPVEPKGDSPEVKKLLQKRVETLREAHRLAMLKLVKANGTPDSVLPVLRRLAKAELEAADGAMKRREALLRVFAHAVKLDQATIRGYKAGAYDTVTFLSVREFRLKVEIDLRRAGGKPPKDTLPPIDP